MLLNYDLKARNCKRKRKKSYLIEFDWGAMKNP